MIPARRLSLVLVAISLIAVSAAVNAPAASAEDDYEVVTLEVTSGEELQVGENLSFTYDATHADSLNFIQVGYADAYGQWRSFDDLDPNGSTFEEPVGEFHRPGVFHFYQVTFSWLGGRSVTYYRGGSTYVRPGQTFGNHSFDLSAFDFEFVNPDADLEVPELVSMSIRSSGPLAVDDPVVIDYEVADQALGHITFVYEGPSGRGHRLSTYEEFPRGSIKWFKREYVQGSWVSGTYELKSVILADRSSNEIELLRNGEAHISPQGLEGPTHHGFNLSQLDFVIDNPNADETPPELQSIALQPEDEYFLSGETLTLSYEFEDLSVTRSVFMLWVIDGEYFSQQDAGYAEPIAGSKVIEIDEDMAVGTYEFYGLSAADSFNNWATYHRDGSHYGVGSSGSHTFDFATLDFRVEKWPYEFVDALNDGGSIVIDPSSGKFRLISDDYPDFPVLRADVSHVSETLVSFSYLGEDVTMSGTFDLGSGSFGAFIRKDDASYLLGNADLPTGATLGL